MLRELGLPANARLVGVVGELWPRKRVKDLIWAVDLLKVFRDDVHLLIFGDGPWRDRYQRYSTQCRNRDKVRFYGDRADIGRFLGHFEVLCQAMAPFRISPPVCLRRCRRACRWSPAIFRHIVAWSSMAGRVFWFPWATVRPSRRYIRMILDNSGLAESLGQAGRQRAVGAVRHSAMAVQYQELYREILE